MVSPNLLSNVMNTDGNCVDKVGGNRKSHQLATHNMFP